MMVTYPTLLAAKRGIVALLLATVASDLCAQDPTQIYAQEVSRLSAIQGLDMDGLGESLSLYDGGVEFRFTDIDIKGNSSLPVRLTRYYKAQAKDFYDAVEGESHNRPIPKMYGVDRWQFEIPHITMTSTALDAWQDDLDRCNYPFPANVAGRGFARREIWNGHHLRIPGRGSQVLYTDDPTRVQVNKRFPVPSDGKVYRWITRDLTRLSCISTTANGYPGEGFLAVTPDGTKYYFNWGYESPAGTLVRRYDQPHGAPEGTEVRLDLIHVTLLATRIEDRFGNYVSLTYSSNSELRRIEANDGRFIQLTPTSTGLVATSSVGTWTYSKQTPGSPGNVVLPDQSVATWSGSGSSTVYYYRPDYFDVSRMKACSLLGNSSAEFSIVNGLPSGVTATYKFRYLVHNRSGMYKSCYETNAYNYRLYVPNYWEQFTLVERRISGPGVPEAVTTYDYQTGHPDRQGDFRKDDGSCTYCRKTKTVTVKHPDQTSSKYIFGVMYEIDEGDLLETQELTAEGAILRRETNTYMDYDSMVSQPYSSFFGYSFVEPLSYKDARFIPVVSRSIVQNGGTFTRVTNAFDKFVRPVSITKSSDINDNPVKTEVTEYLDNLALWVLGQVKRETTDGIETSRTDYHAATALPAATYAFGKLQQTLAYHPDGTLKTVSDGRDAADFDTTMTFPLNLSNGQPNWKRGIPQLIQYPATPDQPSGVTRSAVVNNNGRIDSVTDENGYKTCYTYDSMGRLASITYPDEVNIGQCDVDQSHWKKTTISFKGGYALARGLPEDHWRQYIETGGNRKVILFDALWRPVVEQTYDNTSQATINTTLSEVARRYDTSGRLAFQSYPVRSLDSFTNPNLKGTHTFYDALDRVVSVEQDTELGSRAITSTVYTSNRLKTEVTNPRGKTTYTWYQAYDQPHYGWPIQTYHPESTVTVITRDPFGKPTAIIRRNSTTSETATLEVTRAFHYDINQLLCMVTEPETGTQIFKYDRADNLIRTSLFPLISVGPCQVATESGVEPESGPPVGGPNPPVAGLSTSRTYDARNRLKALSFSDGKGNQVWTYTPDNLPATVSAANPNIGNPSLTTYSYNRRRLLTREVLQPLGGAAAFAANYDYDLHGHLSEQTYPSGLVVDYAPNALGQPKQAGPYATGVNYHPNGAIAEFRYGNGIKHTLSQNDRGLPNTSCDFVDTGLCNAAAFLNDGYDYDKNGNVAAISDGRTGNRGDRTMTYDGLDRLTKVVSPMFGSQGANYKYNALDNLERVYVGGTAARDHYFCYDANWRLTFIRSGPVCTGDASPAVHTLFYDDQGNVSGKDNIDYGFDVGNRLRNSPGYWYAYDGLGRRLLSCTASACRYQMYSQAGQLLYTDDKRTSKRTEAIYLGGSLVALRELDAPTGVYTVKYQHTDALGSPVAVTSANRTILEKTENEPYGKVLNRPLRDGFGYTGHAEDAGTGLTYMQQRYYDPAIGRFLSVDPVTTDGNTGGNFNRYKYASNNPYKFIDPDGRQDGLASHGAGVAIALRNNPEALAMYERSEAAVSKISGGGTSTLGGVAMGKAGTEFVRTGDYSKEAVAGAVVSAVVAGVTHGRGGKQFRGPDSRASGPHTRIRTDDKGNVTHYETYDSPASGQGKRVDVVGPSHGGVPTPHVVETTRHTNPSDPSKSRYTESPPRPARIDEVPRTK